MKGFVKELIKGLFQSYLSGSVIIAVLVKWGLKNKSDEETKKLIAEFKAEPLAAVILFLGWPVMIFDLLTDSRRKHTS